MKYRDQTGKVVSLSTMPAIKNLNKELLSKLLTNADSIISPFIIIDDIDEIHPDSAEEFLRLLEQYVFSDEEAFVHVFLFGRPEGFSPFLTRTDRGKSWGDPLRLNYPRYETVGELSIMVEGYAIFEVLGSEPKAKADWTANEKKNVESIVKVVVPRLLTMVEDNPWLSYTIQNLDLGNFVCESARIKGDWDEWELKTAIVSQIFKRAKETHNRPTFANKDYFQWFEEIASTKINDVEADGSLGPLFDVSEDGDILATVDDAIDSVRARDLLDYSGIVWLDPANYRQRQYRFTPFWVHSYLVERSNLQIDKNYFPLHYNLYVSLAYIKALAGPLLLAVVVILCLAIVRGKGPRWYVNILKTTPN